MNSPPRPLPYPWASLESTSREQVERLRVARAWASMHVDLAAVERTLAEVVQSRLVLRVRRAQSFSGAKTFGDGVAVSLSSVDDPDTLLVVQAETALAAFAVARVLHRPVPRIVETSGAADRAPLAGAFAAIVAAVARRSHESVPLRVTDAGAATDAEPGLRALGPPVTAVTLTVLVADDAYDCRVIFALGKGTGLAAVPSTGGLAWGRRELRALGRMPLRCALVACAARATAADVGRLRVGDVVFAGRFRCVRSAAGGLVGTVLLAPPRADAGIEAELRDDGRLVLGESDVQAVCSEEAVMDELDMEPGIVRAIGDVPVVVRVEIGQACMSAREWSELRRGDVIGLGCRVGERVSLRAGGLVIARGELVNIDGEIGVRLLDRVADEPAER